MYFVVLFFISCNTVKKDTEKSRIVVDSANYVVDCDPGASGLYSSYIHENNYLFNLCIYENEDFLKKIKSPFSQKKITDKLKMDTLIPLKITQFDDIILDVIYKDIDSIPRVYYEFTDMESWDKKKTVGQLYLLYENRQAGNEGRRIFISDTTDKYGVFILETPINRTMTKVPNPKLPQNEGITILRIDGDRKRRSINKIREVNRIILDEEIINKKKHM